MELKQNKKQLREEVIKCANEMNVPVKDLAKAFKIPDKTIYTWLKK